MKTDKLDIINEELFLNDIRSMTTNKNSSERKLIDNDIILSVGCKNNTMIKKELFVNKKQVLISDKILKKLTDSKSL